MKVTVVGAGNVGATVANVIALKKFASEVVLIDIKEGVSEGKAMDMMQSAHALGYDTTVVGVTNDYAATANSDVVVVTSGLPRKPGMTREELVGVNAKIVKSVVEQALKYSPNTIFIIISNPMDAMTYLTLKSTGLPRNRVIIFLRRSIKQGILQHRQTLMVWSSADTMTRRWFPSSALQRFAAFPSRKCSRRKLLMMSYKKRRLAALR